MIAIFNLVLNYGPYGSTAVHQKDSNRKYKGEEVSYNKYQSYKKVLENRGTKVSKTKYFRTNEQALSTMENQGKEQMGDKSKVQDSRCRDL